MLLAVGLAVSLTALIVPGTLAPPDGLGDSSGTRIETEAPQESDEALNAEPVEALEAGATLAVSGLGQEVDTESGGPWAEANGRGIGPGQAGSGEGDTDGGGTEDSETEGAETDGTETDGTDDGAESSDSPTSSSDAPPLPAPTGSAAPGTDLRELYVDGTNGSGSNPGTKDRPFRRPIEATSIAEPGTTVYFRAGTYDIDAHGAFSIKASGTPDNWIRITPYEGERVELVSGGEWNNGFEFLGASYVELSGFVLRGRSDSIHGWGVMAKDGSHDIRVIGNRISGFGGGGVTSIESSRIVIEGNDIRDNAFRSYFQGSGISLFKSEGPLAPGNGFTNVIRGNYVVNNRNEVPYTNGAITDGNCIILDRNNEVGYTGRTLVENNVCTHNGGRGIISFQSGNMVARNNTLYHNLNSDKIPSGRCEMCAGHGENIYFYNNLVFNQPGITSYVSNYTSNTHFANNWVTSGPPPGDGNRVLPSGVDYFASTSMNGSVEQYRPLSGSDLGGTSVTDTQPSTDFFGRTRPRPGAVGAIEP